MKIVLKVLYVIFGLLFINGGLNKFFNYIPVPEDTPEKMMNMMAAIMEISWLMPLIAIAELVGGILFLVNKTRPLAAIVLFPITIGIILTHIFVSPEGLPIALILLCIHLWVIYDNREKYLPMIR